MSATTSSNESLIAEQNINNASELNLVLASAFESEDPLDSSKFDPVEYVNQFLPDDKVLKRLEAHIQQIDKELRDILRYQSDAGTRSARELLECKMAVQELFARVKEIRDKAADSEQLVQDITRDIKNLDNCKKNLLKSSETLRKLQPFFDLVSFFEPMKKVAQIAVLCERVSQFKVDIQRQIMSDFEEGIVRGSARTMAGLLNDACRIVDILGLDVSKDIASVLAKTENTLDVKIMLLALQQTMEFETKVDSRFGDKSIDPTKLNEDGKPKAGKFIKIISSAFEPYLRLYIESEDRNLSDMIDAARTSSDIQEDELVFTSSTDLFLFYRQTLIQCSKFSTNKPFLDLCRLFGKWLRVYADVLSSKLPKEDKKSYTEEEMKTACLVINTADYCSQTTQQLEEKLIEKIDEKFKSTVNFSQETDALLGVTSVAVKSLVHMGEVAIEQSMTLMARRPWGTLESVGDQSDYVTQMGTQIIQLSTNFRKTLASLKYLKTFWDKFSE
ncbi:Vacuolar protein sorting-associated protein 53 [Phlyctochytrium bullatum]|nr:Vacuolar protein sorting-associated protein 53 [Phlyctochytrium bullatum]